MAEIHVQRKHPGIWPALLALLVAAAIIWGVLAVFDGDDAHPPRGPVQSAPSPPDADHVAMTGMVETPAAIADPAAAVVRAMAERA